MSRQGLGAYARSETSHGETSGQHMPADGRRSLPQQKGKRKEDTGKALAGSKKGRSAFEDITNTKREASKLLPSAEKVQELASKYGLPYKVVAQRLASSLTASEEQRRAGLDQRALYGSSMDEALESAALLEEQAWIDIDSADADNELACTDYVEAIMEHLYASEKRRRPSHAYMSTVQRDVHPNMRAILVDWLVEVSLEYKLVSDTLFLAVSYIDRFLSLHVVQRSRLQLVGVACMLLAAKYEEIYAPQVEEFVYITDSTYDRGQILGMEEAVLGALRFELTVPTPRVFLRRFLKASAADWPATGIWRLEHEYLAAYITELALPEYSALQWLPSCIAAAAVLLARHTCAAAIPALRCFPTWSPTLEHYTRYTAMELKPCVLALHSYYVCASSRVISSLPAIREKYAQPKYKCVSTISPPAQLSDSLFAPGLPTPVHRQ